jgi:hypothetical protein
MRYFLLHVTTFVPICAKVLTSHWGLKIAWLVYLFFTYILLEHKRFNGHPVHVFANLQRQAESCLLLGLVLGYWVSPLLSSLPFLLILYGRHIRVDYLSYSALFFLLIKYDIFQIYLVMLSMMCGLMDTEPVLETPEGWHRACLRRVMFRGVQVFCLMTAYETLYVRCILLGAFLFLKGLAWVYAPEDKPDRVVCPEKDPVNFLQGRRHFL